MSRKTITILTPDVGDDLPFTVHEDLVFKVFYDMYGSLEIHTSHPMLFGSDISSIRAAFRAAFISAFDIKGNISQRCIVSIEPDKETKTK